MVKMTEKLMEQVNELMNICLSQTNSIDMIKSMDDDEFKTLKLCMEIMETSKELALKQAKAIETQNDKLDTIIRLLGKRA